MRNEAEEKLENLANLYLQIYSVFAVETVSVDHTDDFGSMDSYIVAYKEPPEKLVKSDYCTEIHNRMFIEKVNYNTYILLQKEGKVYLKGKNHRVTANREGLELILAIEVAKEFHKNQKRADNSTEYISHIKEVAEYFKKDTKTQTIAWLHDIVEDTEITIPMLSKYFDSEIVNGVNYLTRNVGREEYKQRLLKAPKNVQKVKLKDMEHNTKTMNKLDPEIYEVLILRKIEDATKFYIPLALNIEEPDLAKQIANNLLKNELFGS